MNRSVSINALSMLDKKPFVFCQICIVFINNAKSELIRFNVTERCYIILVANMDYSIGLDSLLFKKLLI